jgi:FlaA1/EpsC-like NDP-sugar epimerase
MMFDHRLEVTYSLFMYALLSLVGARAFHTYSGIVRYSSFVDLLNVAYANIVSLVLCISVSLLFKWIGVPSLSAITTSETIAMFIIATLLMWGVRVLVKSLYDVTSESNYAMKALIYGALSGGVGLAKNIRTQRPARFLLRGFISHDKRAPHMQLMGQKVYGMDDDLGAIVKKEGIQAVLVSPLRVNEFRDNQEIQDVLIGAGVKIFMAQNVREASIENGELKDEDFVGVQLKEVSVEDLLPRSEIKIDMNSVGELLRNRRILITGAAGSIGSEMVRQIALYHPSKMMLIDQAETPEHDVRLMMAKEYPDIEAETVVTSICKADRMDEIFSRFRPDYVFHAAAYKHVPMMENNPSEAVQNNIYGTKVIADLSVKYGVKKFVMVSTDKAVNPTNVMGCSKRICEIYVQSLDRKIKEDYEKAVQANSEGREKPQEPCQFVTTRFGNVLGSNGSVIPLFREQIKNGGPVTVTDERIVRYFMLIPEACKLVLEAGTNGNGGEIFVFDMGKPVKIADLARRMIRLSGAKNVKIEYTGLRAGEKLYEEVLNEMEGTKPSFHEKIRIAEVRQYDYEKANRDIEELMEISKHYDDMATVRKMKEIVPEFKSNNSVYEVLDK